MTMITPSYLGETIEYSSLHACRSTLEDPTCPSTRCEHYFAVVDAAGNELVWSGTPSSPLRVAPESWLRRWPFWVAAAALAGTATVFGVRYASDQTQLSSIQSHMTDYTYAQAQSVDQRRHVDVALAWTAGGLSAATLGASFAW